MIASNSNSPRQKMINLMYLVFIAMLAMNIPAEVLDGLEMVEDNLTASVQSAGRRNRLIMSDFEQANKQNPTKVGEWYTSIFPSEKRRKIIVKKFILSPSGSMGKYSGAFRSLSKSTRRYTSRIHRALLMSWVISLFLLAARTVSCGTAEFSCCALRRAMRSRNVS